MKHPMNSTTKLGMFLFAILFFYSQPSSGFEVKSAHPMGLVKNPQQIRVVFSEPMVSLGGNSPLPYQVQCAVGGKGNWEDTLTWIYDFDQPISGGIQCKAKPTSNLKALSGSEWKNPKEISFETGAPSVLSVRPSPGSQIDEHQIFFISMDGKPELNNLEKLVFLQVEGISDQIPVKLLAPSEVDRLLPVVLSKWEIAEFSGTNAKKKNTVLGLKSDRAFPPGKKLRLVWRADPKLKGNSKSEQIFDFQVREEFSAKFSCDRDNANAPCNPIGKFRLEFTAPISVEAQKKIFLQAGSFKLPPRIEKEAKEVSWMEFDGPFSPSAKYELRLPADLKDDADRKLVNADRFPLPIATAPYSPLAKFAASFGVVESTDAFLPITVRNLEPAVSLSHLSGASISIGMENPAKVIKWMQRVIARHSNYTHWEKAQSTDLRGSSLLAREKVTDSFQLPRAEKAEAFEVVGIPLKGNGLHVVELKSEILGKSLLTKSEPMYVAAAALVTNLSVHLKKGSENSLIWVTSLGDGRAVKNAKVGIFSCSGEKLWSGNTDANGVAISEAVTTRTKSKSCNQEEEGIYDNDLYVFAEKDGDYSFVRDSWNQGIEPWRFDVPTGDGSRLPIAHVVLDRTLLRAGETVHMKHFLRQPFLRGLKFKSGGFPKQVVVRHGSGQTIHLPVNFDSLGHAETEWKIPEGAKLGNYSIYLVTNERKSKSDSDTDENLWGDGVYKVGDFHVEEFRLPLMAGSLNFSQEFFSSGEKVSLDVALRYLSGGGAAALSTNTRAMLHVGNGMTFDNFESFSFANGGVRITAIETEEERNKRVDSDSKLKILPSQRAVLDKLGTGRLQFSALPVSEVPMNLTVETEYKDPNGQIQTLARTAMILPSKNLVGLKAIHWSTSKETIHFEAAVANAKGLAVAGKKVQLTLLKESSYSHRERLVGGFYAYHTTYRTEFVEKICEAVTSDLGKINCDRKAPVGGNYIVQAEILGENSKSHTNFWVYDGEDGWYASGNHDRIDLIPEKKTMEPGETLKVQVRTPFQQSTALVSIEREGILDYYVQTLDAKKPILEIPIKPEYAPNVYLSVMLVRGRIGEPKPTALVDLGKPTYKLGIVDLLVSRKSHQLNVAVQTDQEEYRVRAKVKVNLKVTKASDSKPAAGGEVLLLAIDEALLELMPNQSWNLLEAMMGHRILSVETSTVQSQVIGKRHFGLKAVNAGGGGGKSSTRELFDTLLYWKAKLSLNERGEAQAEIPLNDSLTSFKIVAVATEGADRFGTGSHSIHTNQDLMLFSGVSPIARHGDEFRAELTVRNTTAKKMNVAVEGKVDGKNSMARQNIQIQPGESQLATWNLKAPLIGNQQILEFETKGESSSDHLKVTQKLFPSQFPITLQSSVERIDRPLSFPVEKAKELAAGFGGINLSFQSQLGSDLTAVSDYMTRYPYSCLEQKFSKAVALQNKKEWESIKQGLPSYVATDGLLQYFPSSQNVHGSEILTAYILSLAQENSWDLPSETLGGLIRALQEFVKGTLPPGGFSVPAADLSIRKIHVIETLSRYNAFTPELLQSVSIHPEHWPLAALIDWMSILTREQNVANREKKLKEVDQQIRAKIQWRGSVLGFQGEEQEHFWWLMGSIDQEAARLLNLVLKNPEWQKEIPRLVKGLLARQKQGVWDLTTANAWGVTALKHFSDNFEREAVTGESKATLGADSRSIAWTKESATKQEMKFSWPEAKSDLQISHKGTGAPWVNLFVQGVSLKKDNLQKGYKISRSVVPIEQKKKGLWSIGDVYKVRLEVLAAADMSWVVFDDPIPAGATILGSSLALGANQDSSGEGDYSMTSAWPAFEETGFQGYRGYFQWLPKGTHICEYTVRLNGAGKFHLPRTKVEAMYSPEMVGDFYNDTMEVKP